MATDIDKAYPQELIAASIELVKMFDVRWIQPLNGRVPVIAEGLYKGQYFFVKARYETVTFVLAPDENWNYQDEVVKVFQYYVTSVADRAGHLSGKEYIMIIAMFLQTVMDNLDDDRT